MTKKRSATFGILSMTEYLHTQGEIELQCRCKLGNKSIHEVLKVKPMVWNVETFFQGLLCGRYVKRGTTQFNPSFYNA